MNWLARLKNYKAPGDHAREPREPGFLGSLALTEGGDGGFLGSLAPPGGHFQKLPEPAPTAPAEPDALDWHALDAAYQAHHWQCRTCIAGSQGRGQRCPVGLSLWRGYEAAERVRDRAPDGESDTKRAPCPRVTGDNHQAEARAAMSDAEVDRFMARVVRFVDRGLELGQAESIADALVLRDREGDDRRMCIECQHYTSTRSCGRAWTAGLGASGPGELAFRLQRCHAFGPLAPGMEGGTP